MNPQRSQLQGITRPDPERTGPHEPDHRLLVLFDADCGFCTWSARQLHRLDRDRGLRLLAAQSAGEVEGVPPLATLLAAIHARGAGDRWLVGGAAWIEIGRAVAVLRPIAVVAGLPGIRELVYRVYDAVAQRRHRLSRLLGEAACRVDPLAP